ncbi:uncharacterized protein LOC106166744 [Lingula anatina]|uniref:Uncharacterized protein LOC106166744 n=1 Tax=Lingula anatina TaxID=7574 RepID=A0A1S3ITI6_LINAN|nr:uncharacterized protein LOC106166744 [Lingula anatina]|eukprot:XP_013400844.1 uncharacterized protein LOC106166744 [Lingula anatina]
MLAATSKVRSGLHLRCVNAAVRKYNDHARYHRSNSAGTGPPGPLGTSKTSAAHKGNHAPCRSVMFMDRKTVTSGKVKFQNADVYILDMEDSVPIDEKDATREAAARFIQQWNLPQPLYVRTSSIGEAHEETVKDFEFLSHQNLTGYVLPKLSYKVELQEYTRLAACQETQKNLPENHFRFFPILETAQGVANCHELVQSGVTRHAIISLGTYDFGNDVQADFVGETMFHAMKDVLLATRAASLPMIWGIYVLLGDFSGLEKLSQKAKEIGCSGGFALTPAQAVILNRVFSRSFREMNHSRDIVHMKENGGINMYYPHHQQSGVMLGPPLFKKAENILRMASLETEYDQVKAQGPHKSAPVQETVALPLEEATNETRTVSLKNKSPGFQQISLPQQTSGQPLFRTTPDLSSFLSKADYDGEHLQPQAAFATASLASKPELFFDDDMARARWAPGNQSKFKRWRRDEPIRTPHELTIDPAISKLWNSSFYCNSLLASSRQFALDCGMEETQPPLQLLMTATIAMAVSSFTEHCRYHLGFQNAQQRRPIKGGETVTATVRVVDVRPTSGGRYDVVTSKHELEDCHGNVLFTVGKKSMFPAGMFPHIGRCPEGDRKPTTKNPMQEMVETQHQLRSHITDGVEPLEQSELYVHRLVKVVESYESRAFCHQFWITNEHHLNSMKFSATDLLVPGPLVTAASLSNTGLDYGYVLYEEILEAKNINRVAMGDMISSLSLILDVRPNPANPALEEVTSRVFGLINIEPEELRELSVPRDVVESAHLKPSEMEKIFINDCPQLFKKVASVTTRRILRPSPTWML